MLFDIVNSIEIESGVSVYARNLSGDRSRAIIGDGTKAHVINLSDMSIVQTYDHAGAPVYGVALNSDGTIAASTGGDNYDTVIWDVSDGTVIGTHNTGTPPAYSIEFSPNDNYLVAGTAGGNCYVIDPTNGSQIGLYESHTAAINKIIIDSNNKVYTVGSTWQISAWDIATQTQHWLLKSGDDIEATAISLALSPDESELLVIPKHYDDNIYLLDAADGTVIRDNIPTHSGTDEALRTGTYFPGGNIVVLGTGDSSPTNAIRIIDLTDDSLVAEKTDYTNQPIVVGFNDNGDSLVVTQNGSTTVLKQEMIHIDGTIFIVDPVENVVINSDPDYLTYQLDLGTVYQGQNSSIIPIRVVNNTGQELTNIDITVTDEGNDDLTLSKTQDPFDDLQTLNYSSGPYADGAEITLYARLTASKESELGNAGVTLNVQGE